MSHGTPALSGWSDTARQIRRAARTLLVEHGQEGVTLRAIGREVGITAPALYRYYRSHSDLIEHLRRDICTDLATELNVCIAATEDAAGLGQFFAALRGFRRWARTHPREFTLVFASQRAAGTASGSPLDEATEPFGRVFLASVWRVLSTQGVTAPPDERVPDELRADVAAFRSALSTLLTDSTAGEFDEDTLTLGIAYLMIQYWTRIYGHVTLEVFGNVPMPTSNPDAWFEAMLADIARELGFTGST